ncbi:MAG: pilus assembly protein PilM, partial [Candidatus Omnitrophica bacterium]|nr:pilus assembly protein PilM [Candidatus Omnitrophota bacterium]
MVFEQKDTIGIVISDEMILVSRCGRNAAGKKTIANFISVNVPQGMIQNGFISDTKGFSRLLKGIFKDNGIKSRKINVAIQESSTIIHLAKLAKLPEEEFKQLLEDEVSKYMAYGEVPVIGHYSIGHGDTVIIAIRKSIVKALLEATDKAGLEVIGVDIPSMAVLRTLIHDGNIDLNKDKSVAVILCGNKTSMLIVKDGMPSYFRTLSATDIEELAKEVRITTAYWEEQYPERGIDKTIILGDTSKAKELDMELSDEGGVVESSGIIPDKFDLMRSASAGLALRNEKNRSIFDVNLLPEERFIRLRLEKLLLTSVIIIGLIALVSLSVSSVFSLGIISYEKKIEVINKKAETQPR